MSHDLRAPLRVVEGFTRILKEDYGPQLDAQANQHLDRVLSAADRMEAMLNALLAQAQLTSEPLQRQAVDVSALAREVGREQLGVLNGAARAELVVADGLVAQADPALLRRVFENLIGNALKYSEKVDCPRVSVGVIAETDPEVFYVRDNGAGFEPCAHRRPARRCARHVRSSEQT
jgi:signal transduction histidine kinase